MAAAVPGCRGIETASPPPELRSRPRTLDPRQRAGGTHGICQCATYQVFDCGPDRLCHTADDVTLPVVSATLLPNGNVLVTLAQPLVPGQKIYATDGCSDPALSVFALVPLGPAPLPTLSGSLLVALGALLAFVGLLGLSRIGPFARRG